jgi:hypothetical protein
MLTADLELVERIDGYYDVVYGTYEPKYLNWYFPHYFYMYNFFLSNAQEDCTIL